MNKNENKTLDCDIVCDLLELYHDDIVRPTTKKAVDSHLENCESCKKEYEKITAISPSPQELSTRKEFAKLMKKKRPDRDGCFAWEKVKERFIEEFVRVEGGFI